MAQEWNPSPGPSFQLQDHFLQSLSRRLICIAWFFSLIRSAMTTTRRCTSANTELVFLKTVTICRSLVIARITWLTHGFDELDLLPARCPFWVFSSDPFNRTYVPKRALRLKYHHKRKSRQAPARDKAQGYGPLEDHGTCSISSAKPWKSVKDQKSFILVVPLLTTLNLLFWNSAQMEITSTGTKSFEYTLTHCVAFSRGRPWASPPEISFEACLYSCWWRRRPMMKVRNGFSKKEFMVLGDAEEGVIDPLESR